jgi:hypothetical protein
MGYKTIFVMPDKVAQEKIAGGMDAWTSAGYSVTE